ncbi:DUF3048 domain-containing protein [Bacillus suaedae]|uniref:DUF3048 domain-containing protein n=1 Tax=Halalkalibacter suaedae TaxID=2822140 RepID=A0A941ARG8_9BACI|nr:DUF3048 domain-containing protein [Bacillus suaedae]MBP3952573.1 DUF3048 domain-containing protein [Bacillus suaedae]
MKSTFLLTVLLAGGLTITGCSTTEEAEQSESNEPIVEPIEIEEEEQEEIIPPSSVFPLTGMATDEELERRVIGVSINNDPAARPQSGLIEADIVYEMLAEGTITRFIALYHSTLPERIGPVRSSRTYHIDLLKGYNSIFVNHGWSPEAKHRLTVLGELDYISGMVYDGYLFKRSSDRVAPHNSYISPENIFKGVELEGYELNGEVPELSFYDGDPAQLAGDEGKNITLRYSNNHILTYDFDDQLGLYTRANGNEPTVDYETGEPQLISNLLVIETEHKVLDSEGRRSIDLTSGGQALLFQNGKARKIEWENRDGIMVPVSEGEVIPLLPGQTWVNIVPMGMEQSVTY